MSLDPGHLAERRARLRAQQRRRRLGMVGILLALIGVGVGVAVAATGGGGAAKTSASRVPACGARANCGSPTPTQAPHAPQPGTPDAQAGIANIKKLIPLGLPIYCAGPHGNAVAFTFDDGPGVYTHYAVPKLQQSGERATFFVVGKSMDAWPGWIPREAKVAAFGDHTYTHPELTALSPDEVRQQLASTKQKVETQSGQPVYLWRPPYGARNSTVDQIGKRLGMLEILWSTDSADSLGADWSGIIRNVEAGLHPGAIILMHENHGQTIRALTTLLPELKRRHLRSISLPELFASDPPTAEQVKRGPDGCAGTAKSTPGSGG